jgi:hypothetical protein
MCDDSACEAAGAARRAPPSVGEAEVRRHSESRKTKHNCGRRGEVAELLWGMISPVGRKPGAAGEVHGVKALNGCAETCFRRRKDSRLKKDRPVSAPRT